MEKWWKWWCMSTMSTSKFRLFHRHGELGLLGHDLWTLIMFVDEFQDVCDLFLLCIVGALLSKSGFFHCVHIGLVITLTRQKAAKRFTQLIRQTDTKCYRLIRYRALLNTFNLSNVERKVRPVCDVKVRLQGSEMFRSGLVIGQLPAIQQNDVRANCVQEAAVMGDNEASVFEWLQVILQVDNLSEAVKPHRGIGICRRLSHRFPNPQASQASQAPDPRPVAAGKSKWFVGSSSSSSSGCAKSAEANETRMRQPPDKDEVGVFSNSSVNWRPGQHKGTAQRDGSLLRLHQKLNNCIKTHVW